MLGIKYIKLLIYFMIFKQKYFLGYYVFRHFEFMFFFYGKKLGSSLNA
jgi:hypothetical protein